MILRRFTQHIKEQNWFAVGLDVVVVIFGVYLGIFIGDAVERGTEQNEINRDLASLKTVTTTNIQLATKIVESQIVIRDSFAEAVSLLLDKQVDEDALITAMKKLTTIDTPTFYPDTSNYHTLVSSGYLNKVQPIELRYKITHLYEYTLNRHSDFSKLYDANIDSIYKDTISRYWDRNKLQLLTINQVEKDVFRSKLQGQVNYTEGYIAFLEDVVIPPMLALKDSL